MIFFLNSSNRVYNDKEINKVPQILFSDGVFNTTQATKKLWDSLGDFFVEASGVDMNITAKAGSASVQVTSGGKLQRIVIEEANPLVATVQANPDLANRNDAVILRIDQALITADELNVDGSNAVSLAIISGNSATPLTDSEISVALGGDPFVRFANILVPQSATSINQTQITDVRSLVKMSRAVKISSDALRLYALAEDPTTLEQGDIWYNSTEGILKFYDGVNVSALQTETFDWGYYPPSGIDNNTQNFEAVAENDGTDGSLANLNLIYSSDPLSTVMGSQLIKMPNVSFPFIQIKMGSLGTYKQANIAVKIYNVDGSNNITTLKESKTFTASEVIQNDYINFFLVEAYTPATNYMIVIQSTTIGNFNNVGDTDDFMAIVQKSHYVADTTFLGTKNGSATSLQLDPLSGITWSGLSPDTNWVMKIAERGELGIGKSDISGNVHKILQPFISKSKDILSFIVTKGTSIGSPTGSINASLFLADNDGLPTGNVLTSATITNAVWATGVTGAQKSFAIIYDKLIVGAKYVIVIDTDNYSDDNYYTIYFGSYALGTAKKYNTANGWVSLAGDIYYSTLTSSVNKIVVTDGTGKIPSSLLPKYINRVAYITSSATPMYSIDSADSISITALAEAITNMSTYLSGVPYDFMPLTFRIKDNGTSRAIAWGSLFENKGATMPTATTLGKVHTVKFLYNSVTSKFGCILAVVEA